GIDNHADGDYSFAAGRSAFAPRAGMFSFADDSTSHSFAAGGAANTFNVRATAGVWLWTGINASGDVNVGAVLPGGSSSWGTLSDRHLKRHVVAVDPRAVLGKVARLPIDTWSYTTQSPRVRHMGPMA